MKTLQWPMIVLQLPETIGTAGVIGLYANHLNHSELAIKEGFSHLILFVLPRPLTPNRLLFIAEEVRAFVEWAKRMGEDARVEIV